MTRPTVLRVVADHSSLPGDVDTSSCMMLDAWLHRLGPGCTVLWMHLSAMLREAGTSTSVPVLELANWAGIMPSVLWRLLDRLAVFSPVSFAGTDVIVVPLHAPSASRRRHRESVPS